MLLCDCAHTVCNVVFVLIEMLPVHSKELFLCFYREKKLLVSSDDYGRDLTGVQNLRKKHKRLEAELSSHEPSIQVNCCIYMLFLWRAI